MIFPVTNFVPQLGQMPDSFESSTCIFSHIVKQTTATKAMFYLLE